VATRIHRDSRFTHYGLTNLVWPARSDRPWDFNLPSEVEAIYLFFSDWRYATRLGDVSRLGEAVFTLMGGVEGCSLLRQRSLYDVGKPQPTARPTASYRSVTMEGASTFPTIRNGEKLRVDTAAYRSFNPSRRDIIWFRAVPAGQPDKRFIKRIIGLPGETVSVHNDAVYINNHRLSERYIGAAYRARYPFSATLVPQDEYFVLGDNRNNSLDSHLWGMLAKRSIVGKVVTPS
jgi:signal peptidase I